MGKKIIRTSTLTWTDKEGVEHEEEVVHELDPDTDLRHTHLGWPTKGKNTTHSHEGGDERHTHGNR